MIGDSRAETGKFAQPLTSAHKTGNIDLGIRCRDILCALLALVTPVAFVAEFAEFSEGGGVWVNRNTGKTPRAALKKAAFLFCADDVTGRTHWFSKRTAGRASAPSPRTRVFPAVAQFGETRRSQKPLLIVVRIHSAGPISAQVALNWQTCQHEGAGGWRFESSLGHRKNGRVVRHRVANSESGQNRRRFDPCFFRHGGRC